jgi:hypothetical protein
VPKNGGDLSAVLAGARVAMHCLRDLFQKQKKKEEARKEEKTRKDENKRPKLDELVKTLLSPGSFAGYLQTIDTSNKLPRKYFRIQTNQANHYESLDAVKSTAQKEQLRIFILRGVRGGSLGLFKSLDYRYEISPQKKNTTKYVWRQDSGEIVEMEPALHDSVVKKPLGKSFADILDLAGPLNAFRLSLCDNVESDLKKMHALRKVLDLIGVRTQKDTVTIPGRTTKISVNPAPAS